MPSFNNSSFAFVGLGAAAASGGGAAWLDVVENLQRQVLLLPKLHICIGLGYTCAS